jgi:hypothetical protein
MNWIGILIQEVRSMEAIQWLMISIFTSLFSAIIFFAFKWYYSDTPQAVAQTSKNLLELHKAQDDLQKASMVGLATSLAAAKEQISEFDASTKAMEKDLDHFREGVGNLREALVNATRNYLISIKTTYEILTIMRIGLTFRSLWGYLLVYEALGVENQIAGAPSTVELFQKLEALDSQYTQASLALRPSKPADDMSIFQNQLSVPKEVVEFPASRLTEQIDTLRGELSSYCEKAFSATNAE